MKRYRRPKVTEGQIKAQRGSVDGEIDLCLFYGDDVPRCDRALIMHSLFSSQYNFTMKKQELSLAEELELRGYDLDTLKFTITKKDRTTKGE